MSRTGIERRGAKARSALLVLLAWPATAHAQPPTASDLNRDAGLRGATHLGFDPSMLRTEADDPLHDLGLREQHDGGLLYVDPHARFTARFNPDGTVHFADRWKRPDRNHPDKGACCGVPADGFNPLHAQMSGPVEWLLKMQGKDVLAREKAELLDRTRPLRTRQAIAFTKRLIAERLDDLAHELDGIVTDSERDLAERRRLLFERWDECDERFAVAPDGIPDEAISEIDAERLHAATTARRRIEAVIRRQLATGSARAYSTGELRELNARRLSHETFDPYIERDLPPARPSRSTEAGVAADVETRPTPPRSPEPPGQDHP